MDIILSVVSDINDFLWTYFVIPMLVVCAIYFTWNLHAIQFMGIGEMFRLLFSSSSLEKDTEKSRHKRISSFQAFAISLSSRVGTGNLAGVASAIFVGGPGSVFWMWIMALFGAGTAFMEATLAQLFKRRGADSYYGGPAYQMQYGLHRRWMGVLFAVFIIFGFGLANQVVQSNTLCDAIGDAFHLPVKWVAYAITALTLVIIFGGVHRIARFSATIVPIMAIGYLLLSMIILILNIDKVPAMLALIIKSAFGWQQAAGGAVGMAIMQGVKRGLFSNEAGEGSAPNAAATASISHPVKQGLLQSLGVFTDTLLICTCTAFIILLSGFYDGNDDGIILTSRAMNYHLGSMGSWYLTVCIFLFAYSTIIANYFYGEANIRFICDKKWAITTFRFVSGFVVMAGGFLTLQQAWCIVDLAMALMTILNLTSVLMLARYSFLLLDDYLDQRRSGKNPEFHKEQFHEIVDELEGW